MIEVAGAISVQFARETLCLLPERAIYLPSQHALIVADLHFGKAASLRVAGVPVPTGSTGKDLSRLAALLQKTVATQLIILGDFLHARSGCQQGVFDAIAEWREAHRALDILLIRGNHDRSAGRVPSRWNIREVEEPFESEGLLLCHAPRADESLPVLCGHVHPVFSMQDFDRSSVRVPCFVIDECESSRSVMLPAFSSFAGGFAVQRASGRRIFLSASRVVAVPG